MATTKKKPATKTKGKISSASKFMLVVNLIFVILLLLSYLSLYISPEYFWPIAFAGLVYPVFFLINLFFVLFWLVFLKKYFILSLITILLGYNQVNTYIKLAGSGNKLSFENSLTVMSYNVRLFDLYNWRNESSKTTKSLIFNLFKSESPDILCIQDYYNGPRKRADFGDTICRMAAFNYRSIELMSKDNKGFPYGLAIFSKYPLFNPQKIEFPNSKVNFCQSGDVKIGKDTIRIINMHLESIKFGKEDYTFVNEVTNAQTANEKFKKGFLAIFGKMKSAYLKRAPQIEVVTKFVQSSPYPVILTGDFNDTPVSYSYRQIANELDDTFVDAGKGLGQTHSQIISMLRIDYIFHSEKFKTIEHRTIDKDYSDHYPVVARFEFSDEK